jgi:hypothetical protein
MQSTIQNGMKIRTKKNSIREIVNKEMHITPAVHRCTNCQLEMTPGLTIGQLGQHLLECPNADDTERVLLLDLGLSNTQKIRAIVLGKFEFAEEEKHICKKCGHFTSKKKHSNHVRHQAVHLLKCAEVGADVKRNILLVSHSDRFIKVARKHCPHLLPAGTPGEIVRPGGYAKAKVILPNNTMPQVLKLFSKISKWLKDNKKKVEKWAEEWNEEWNEAGSEAHSMQVIDGGRYELYLFRTSEGPTVHCDYILKNILGGDDKVEPAKRDIMNYIKSTAGANQDWQYGDFSILVSYNAVEQQGWHIDAITNQNELIFTSLTNKTPSTLEFVPIKPVESISDLFEQEVWNRASAHTRRILKDVIQHNSIAEEVLKEYGDLLANTGVGSGRKAGKVPLQTGAMTILPGSVVHAGPECRGFRAIIFCTRHSPQLPQHKWYLNAVQEFQLSALLLLLRAIWKEVSGKPQEFLCEMLKHIAKRTEPSCLERIVLENVQNNHLKEIVKEIIDREKADWK